MAPTQSLQKAVSASPTESPDTQVLSDRLTGHFADVDGVRLWPGSLTINREQADILAQAGRNLAEDRIGYGIWPQDFERLTMLCAEAVALNVPTGDTAPAWDKRVIIVTRNQQTARNLILTLSSRSGFGIDTECIREELPARVKETNHEWLGDAKILILSTGAFRKIRTSNLEFFRDTCVLIDDLDLFGSGMTGVFSDDETSAQPAVHHWALTDLTNGGYRLNETHTLLDRAPFCSLSVPNAVRQRKMRGLRSLVLTTPTIELPYEGKINDPYDPSTVSELSARPDRENAAVYLYATHTDQLTGHKLRDHRAFFVAYDKAQAERLTQSLNQVFGRDTFARTFTNPRAHLQNISKFVVDLEKDDVRAIVGIPPALCLLRPPGFTAVFTIEEQSIGHRSHDFLNWIADLDPDHEDEIGFAVNCVTNGFCQSGTQLELAGGEAILAASETTAPARWPLNEEVSSLPPAITMAPNILLLEGRDELASFAAERMRTAAEARHTAYAIAHFLRSESRQLGTALGLNESQTFDALGVVRRAYDAGSADGETFHVPALDLTLRRIDVWPDPDTATVWIRNDETVVTSLRDAIARHGLPTLPVSDRIA